MRYSTRIIFLLFLCYVVLFWLNGLGFRRKGYVQDDALQHVMYAYNLVHHGVISDVQCSKEPAPEACNRSPSAYRGPGYPFFLALNIALNPKLRALDEQQIVKPEFLNPLRNSELLLLWLTSIFIYKIVFILTQRRFPAFVALLSVGFNPILLDYQNEFYSENFGALLVTILSYALLMAYRSGRYRYYGLSGFLTGCLTLTIPIFYYLPWLFIIVSFGLSRSKKIHYQQWLKTSGIFLICFAGVVLPWMVRNYLHFDRFYITERAGAMLNVRAEKDLMNKKEFFAAFCYWSNCSFLQSLRKPFENDPAFHRLIRGNPDSFYRTGRVRRLELNREHGPVVADKLLLREAVEKITSHPFRHLAVTLPVMFRGMGMQSCGLDFILFGSTLLLFLASIAKRDGQLFILLLPTAYCYAFYSLVTYHLPRYSLPLLPMFWVATIVALYRLTKRMETNKDDMFQSSLTNT